MTDARHHRTARREVIEHVLDATHRPQSLDRHRDAGHILHLREPARLAAGEQSGCHLAERGERDVDGVGLRRYRLGGGRRQLGGVVHFCLLDFASFFCCLATISRSSFFSRFHVLTAAFSNHRIRRRETPSRLRARAQGFEKAAVRTWKRLKQLEREIVAKQQKKLAKSRRQK